MELSRTETDDIQVITVMADRIDSAVAIQFKDAVRTHSQDGPDRVLLDLHRVSFVDSSGLGAIVTAMKRLAPERRLQLAALNPEVDRVFRLTRMDTVFDIFADVPSAMHAAKQV